MAIIKDVTVKINNGTATLDAPVQFYEKDHDVELRFKLMDYKYKYDKDPQNILNSVDEDILEAYTTIVNPKGYELEQINGVVKNDIVIFRLDPTYTDELDELGTYKLQIHIKCTHSEFTIPPITFEVLQRLKGIKVVTDGEDEVDNSEILDNSSKFVSDETGKLIIEWKKGDMISSAKLNAMVDVINDAVDEEAQRQLNEVKREQQELEREQQELERQNELQEALDSVDARVDESMTEYETRFNALTASQQQDMEVIDARDGEVSLKARLDRDLRNPLQVYEDVEGSCISCDSVEGYAQNVEILGNTIQNQNDLADIRSVGDKLENQELYEIPVLSTGKNLINVNDVIVNEGVNTSTGNFGVDSSRSRTPYIKFNPNTNYVGTNVDVLLFYDENKQFISSNRYSTGVSPSNCKYVVVRMLNTTTNWQLEEGTVATPYEPYVEDKLTILSPTPLEKVGDIVDRIICKDGVWGVEKNIKTEVVDGTKGTFKTLYKNDVNTDFYMWASITDILPSSSILTNLLTNKQVWNEDHEGIYVHNEIHTDNIRFRFLKTRGIPFTVNGITDFFKTNPMLIKYPTTQPTFIPLPHDQQIALRTFANKTNIHFLTEIDPTLKASVPKSISATVSTHAEQIDNLGKELNKVKKLEESTVSTVATESSFTTVTETSNGYFEDVKLEGRTLVNLYPKLDAKNYSSLGATLSNDTITINANGSWRNFMIKKDVMPLKTSTYYTFVIYIIDNTITGDNPIIHFGDTLKTDPAKFRDSYHFVLKNKKGIYAFKLKTKDSFDNVSLDTRDHLVDRAASGTIVFKYMILEGDHTQNPPEYFEGIKSVGDGVEEITIATTNAPMLFGKGGKK